MIKDILEMQFAGIPLLSVILFFIALNLTKKIIKVILFVGIVILLFWWYKNNFEVQGLQASIDNLQSNWITYRTLLIVL